MLRCQFRQTGSRVDLAGSAGHQHRVAVQRGSLAGLKCSLGDRLAEPDHIRAQQTIAQRARLRLLAPGDVYLLYAVRVAAVAMNVAVELDYPVRTGPLVQTVNVLCDQRDTGQPVCQRRNGEMPGIRLSRVNQATSPLVPLLHQRRVTGEGVRRGELLRPEA